MNHFIGKNRFELRFADSEVARHFQHEVSRYFWRTMVPGLDRLFDKLCDQHQTISLDRVEIDLGHISEEVLLKNQLWELVQKPLEEQVAMAKRQTATRISIRGQATLPRSGPLDTRGEEGVFAPFDRWLFYLSRGYYAWDMPLPGETFAKEVIETLAADQSAILRLRKLITEAPSVLPRLVASHIHQPDTLRQLLEVYTARRQGLIPACYPEWVKLVRKKKIRQMVADEYQQPQGYWIQLLQQVIIQRQKQGDEELLHAFFAAVFHHTDHLPILLEEIEKNRASFPSISALLQRLPPEWTPSGSRQTAANKEQSPVGITGLDHKTEFHPAIPGSLKPTQGERSDGRDAPVASEEAAIYVAHAGLVLTYPFIARLFATLGYTKEDKFVDTFHQEKAIGLLHYLATGQAPAEEYALVLPKLLCAWPLTQPLVATFDFRENEWEEGTRVLEAIIEHWEVLGATSPEGLRQGYLQRAGKLLRKETGWHLTVEKNTIDILLDKLPWPLSMLRLPWMNDSLRVDWR